MIAVTEAVSLVLQQQTAYGTEAVPILQSVGRILASNVTADRDYPAFNRVTMDGIAVNSSALKNGQMAFAVQAVQAAGDMPLSLQSNINCIEIMTGAVLPQGTDAVIPYEDINIYNNIATVKASNTRPYQHVHKKGTDINEGSTLLIAGTKLSAVHTGVLASAGIHHVPVKRLPKVAVCSTGNELVDIDRIPLPHQVRRSNQYMLTALLQEEQIIPAMHHLPDDKEVMAAALDYLVKNHEIIILSGAVSKGKYDYLPGVLAGLGMRTIFHGIAQRPGKPMLFGQCANGTLVFGFPGNPISTFACYHLYFKAWLQACLQYTPVVTKARLANEVVFKPNLSYHLPVQLKNEDGVINAIPVQINTSGDIPSLATIDGLVTLPAEQTTFEAGLLVTVNLC